MLEECHVNSSVAQRKIAYWGAVFLLIMLAATVPSAANAQDEPRYFYETGHYIRGAFRSFWERSGNVPIFGFPITEEYRRKSDNRIVQYFERARFELDVQTTRAVVNLGTLGIEYTHNEAYPKSPPISNSSTRRYFPETGHTLQGAFKTFWESSGGVPIFGFPISEEINEQLSDGRLHTVQYFERTRFELWSSGVQLGLLGRALAPSQLLEPWPPNYPPPGPLSENGTPRPPATPPPPAAAPPGDPAKLGNVLQDGLQVRGDGSIIPLAAPLGFSFSFAAHGFDPTEPIGAWLTKPIVNGVQRIDSRLIRPDGSGNVNISFETARLSEGIWTISAQGQKTGHNVTAPFILTHDYVAPPSTPRPPNHNGNVNPAQGGQQTVFRLNGAGFRANELLEQWITSPNGIYYLADRVRADGAGRIGFSPGLSVHFGAQDPAGVYGYHYRGTNSGVRVDVYMTFTG